VNISLSPPLTSPLHLIIMHVIRNEVVRLQGFYSEFIIQSFILSLS
jgi:hypothetical protein